MSGTGVGWSRADQATVPHHPAAADRLLPTVALLALAALLVVGAGWAALTFGVGYRSALDAGDPSAGSPPPIRVATVGAEVPITGGFARVEGVADVAPAGLGAAAAAGTHAVRVTLVAAASAGTPVTLDVRSIALDGNGFGGPIQPTSVSPPTQRPAGGGTEWTLVYAVPDTSSDLVLALPGGSVVVAGRAQASGLGHVG